MTTANAKRNNQKRPISIERDINVFLLIAGIFVHYLGANLKEISFQYLINVENLIRFKKWFIEETRNRQIKLYAGIDPLKCTGVTHTLYNYLIILATTAKYFLYDIPASHAIREEIL